jgi:hypothetical protein
MDISEWSIVDLHRKGNKRDVWFFKVVKPDGKRLIVDRTDYYSRVWSNKMPGTAVYAESEYACQELYVSSLTEAGAVRKITRYLEFLAKDWNLRKEIKAAGVKQITFDGKKPSIIGSDRQLEA